jgi:hypothetical protein
MLTLSIEASSPTIFMFTRAAQAATASSAQFLAPSSMSRNFVPAGNAFINWETLLRMDCSISWQFSLSERRKFPGIWRV